MSCMIFAYMLLFGYNCFHILSEVLFVTIEIFIFMSDVFQILSCNNFIFLILQFFSMFQFFKALFAAICHTSSYSVKSEVVML